MEKIKILTKTIFTSVIKLVSAGVLLFCFAGCKETILHNLSETDANKLIAELDEHNIRAEKKLLPSGSWAITVPSSHAVQAIRLVNENRLVKRNRGQESKTSSMLSTKEDQRFLYERNLSGEIEQTLISINGVLDARVHLNLAPTDPLFGRKLIDEPSSGSVLLVVGEEFNIQKDSIAELVGGAAGIEPANIRVLISPSGISASRTKEAKDEKSRINQLIGKNDNSGNTPDLTHNRHSEQRGIFSRYKDYILQTALGMLVLVFLGVFFVREKKQSRLKEIRTKLSAIGGE